VVLGLLLVFIVGMAIWSSLRSTEPVYKKRPLHSWLDELQQWSTQIEFQDWIDNTNDPLFVAFRTMGTSALPELLSVAQYRESPLENFIAALNRRQSLVKIPGGEILPRDVPVSWALYAIGSNALPALPALTNLLFHTNLAMAFALVGIGPEAVPGLIESLTNKEVTIRLAAARSLGHERTGMDLVVPALLARLPDTSPFPRMERILLRREAIMALGKLHADAQVAVPALITNLSSTDETVRILSLVALGQYGTNARAAIPAIRATLNNSIPTVCSNAILALGRIEPDAQGRK
jgi:HEAT repeat protein